ncbi:uncharacterized protein EDB93DRAFT_497001 [Suillus bovinus]|uniref:uncharacterized protein n=1 Tax=Suillus bovinus TaxID=48563 RepID=UPI001B883016|nr:uncharacterized protein EDB93DRAFT_497001 [Suillus bovinus]KAG2146010.1 hypothetical protein EDB93DRAFT_497001 [Suillus bovinus]
MLSGDRRCLGLKAALNSITPSSLSVPQSSSALPDVPDITHLPIPIPPISKIAEDTNTAEPTSNHPDSLHPSHFELANPPGRSEVSTPRLPQLSYVKGPFRAWRRLSVEGFATAIAAEDIASGRLVCLKVFRKNRLQEMDESLRMELEVYKRLVCSREFCPATMFLMELEMSFQTKKNVCLVMDLMAYDLSHHMLKGYAYCVQNARRWSAQLARGINALPIVI